MSNPDESLPDEISHGLSLNDLTRELLSVRERIIALREHERFLVDEIYDMAPQRRNETAYGVVEVAKRRNRKWDHEAATRHVVARALDERVADPNTGEIEPSWQAVARALRECAGIAYWRAGALRERGLDPDEFAETTSEGKSVRVV